MRKLKTILGILAALVVIVGISIPAAALACHLIVEPNNVTLYVGQHQQYTATYYDINNHPHNVTNDSNTTWTVTGGGTIGVHNGDFTATTPGTNFKVKATYNGYSSQVTVNVLALPTYTVTYNGNGSDSGTVPIDPSSPYTSGSSVTVLGNSGSLAKTGYTFNGWNTASDGSGTPYAPGSTFNITASTILYAQWTAITITSITVTPPSATIPVGATQQYTATAHYSDGSSQDITTIVDWSVGGGGTIGLNTGLFTGITVGGPFPVTATLGLISGTAEVTVIAHGELVSITVDPANATIPVGATQQYTATGHDAYGNAWDITTVVTWSVDGGGTIGPNTGLFTGTTPGGPFTVTATWSVSTLAVTRALADISGTAEVIVIAHGDLLSIIVDPPSATIPVGATQQYIATGYDTYGNYWDITTIADWSVGGGGTIGLNTGLFTGITVGGPFPVTATLGLISGTAQVTVIAHGELVSITVNPPSATINVGATQQYTATGHDAYGNSWDITDIVTWTVSGGGDIGPNTGLFDATTVGDAFTVTATWGLITGSVTGTALVNVVTETTPTTTPTTTTTETTTTTTTTTETIPTETQTIGPPVTETNNWWLWTLIGIVALILILLFILFFFKWQKVLVFVKEIPATAAGKVSDMITVQVRYQNGDAYDVKKDEKVFLNTKSATGKFDVSAAGAFDGSLKNVVIPKDKNTVSFYYKDSKGGEYTITAKKTNMLPWKRGALKVNIK
jgi:uncharacterized repeat protein (TIGR02543 family)